MHAIDHVHVRAAGRTEHRRVALGLAFARMACQVMRSKVRFGLHDARTPTATLHVANESGANEFPRDEFCIAGVESATKPTAGGHGHHTERVLPAAFVPR